MNENYFQEVLTQNEIKAKFSLLKNEEMDVTPESGDDYRSTMNYINGEQERRHHLNILA